MGNHSVLVVDTEKSVVDRVKSALSADGYKVQAAGSSQEAIDVVKREKPQLLIINPIMPVRSGVVIAKETSQAVGAKVLFLTELARDPDFREVLRGLRQQGCECTALGREVEVRELLSHVRREIGPVIILTDQEDVLGEPVSPGRTPQTVAAPARAPLPEFQPLLQFVGPLMYERNAFKLTGLRVDASLRDVSKQAERLEMMAKLAAAGGPSSNKQFGSTEAIRNALQSLKNPEERLVQEFFWFWPTGQDDTDAALQEVSLGHLETAEKLWLSVAVGQNELSAVSARLDQACTSTERQSLLEKKQQLERATATCVHNLAVLNHLCAIASARDPKAPATKAAGVKFWRDSFHYWQKLRDQHLFWELVVDRIRVINDPRLSVDVAERIWLSLPLALLLTNALFAIDAAEAGRFEDAGQQRRVMKESGLGDSFVREALCRRLKPLNEELQRLCETAETESSNAPERGANIVRKLFEDKKKYLQTFNYLLGAGDPFRDVALDLVAQTARSALVAYANKTEDWEAALPLFEECLALAESKSLRSRLEDDLEMLASNAAAYKAAKRMQATAAPSGSSQAAQQPRPSASNSTIPASRANKANRTPWLVIAAVAIIGTLIIIGYSTEDRPSTSSSSAPSSAGSREAPTAPANNASYSDNDVSSAPRGAVDPSAGTTPSSTGAYYPRNGRDSAEIASLRSTIESNRANLARMESELTQLDNRMSSLKSEIDSDKATLRRMERDHDLGYEVDTDLYETTRQRHNSAVAVLNRLVNEYNASLPEYKALLNTTNAQIDRYNMLVRSR